jgi:hypothetical protein
MGWILGLAGGDVKSAGRVFQDVPKLPEVGCLFLVPPIYVNALFCPAFPRTRVNSVLESPSEVT